MELGLYSFGDTTPEPGTGVRVSSAQRLRDLLEEIELADQLGLDVFGVGEHHRKDFAVSAPAVVLAAAAARTTRIRLTSAVTVLGSDDPVRVFQAFATLDLLSGGRAEIMVGRGSFIESYALFGFDLRDYDELFPERFAGLVALYRDSARRAGHDSVTVPVGINAHAFVAGDSQAAADEFFPPYAEAMTRIGRERGWPATTREQFEALRSTRGALAVGSPAQVAEKILFMHEMFGHQRHLLQMSVGTLPHASMMRSIELFGTRVAPVVRAEVAKRATPVNG